MPLVVIEMLEGRTVEQKKKLVEGITSAFVSIGTPEDALHIVMKDNPRHNMAHGSKLLSEK